MSGLEQRTKGRDETPASATAVIAFTARLPAAESAAEPTPPLPPPAPREWPPIDADLLDVRRAPVPAFLLELLPQP